MVKYRVKTADLTHLLRAHQRELAAAAAHQETGLVVCPLPAGLYWGTRDDGSNVNTFGVIPGTLLETEANDYLGADHVTFGCYTISNPWTTGVAALAGASECELAAGHSGIRINDLPLFGASVYSGIGSQRKPLFGSFTTVRRDALLRGLELIKDSAFSGNLAGRGAIGITLASETLRLKTWGHGNKRHAHAFSETETFSLGADGACLVHWKELHELLSSLPDEWVTLCIGKQHVNRPTGPCALFIGVKALNVTVLLRTMKT